MTTTTPVSPTEASDQFSPQPVAPAQPVVAPSQTLSILSLVFGLASLVLGLGFLAGVAGIVLGALAWNRERSGHTLAIIGMISGALSLVGGVIIGILGFAFAAPFLATIPFWGAF